MKKLPGKNFSNLMPSAAYLLACVQQMEELARYSTAAHERLCNLNAMLAAIYSPAVEPNVLSVAIMKVNHANDLPSRLPCNAKDRRITNAGNSASEQLGRHCRTSTSNLPLRVASGLNTGLQVPIL